MRIQNQSIKLNADIRWNYKLRWTTFDQNKQAQNLTKLEKLIKII